MQNRKPTLNQILDAIKNGERLGIDESLIFLAESKNVLDRKGLDTFFESARQLARKHPSTQRLDIDVIDLTNTSLASFAEIANKSDSEQLYLKFPSSYSFAEIITSIEVGSKSIPLFAFTPKEILDRSRLYNMKVVDFCKSLAFAGLSGISGKFDAKGNDTEAIDEVFSVMMQLAKLKLKLSAYLPMSFNDEEKALHLAKLREFQDRTNSILFVVLYLDCKFGDRELLRTIALLRLMLDNISTISLTDFNLHQSKKLDSDLLRQSSELGINQI